MGTNLMGELVADMGTYIANNTTEVTRTIEAIVVLQDTVFTSIKVAGTDVKSTYIAAPGTAVKAGAIITPINNLQFSGVQLASGSVALVLG
jgi:hypothetical protein